MNYNDAEAWIAQEMISLAKELAWGTGFTLELQNEPSITFLDITLLYDGIQLLGL